MGSNFTVGRPIKYSYKTRCEILDKLDFYIQSEEYPTMPKFCVINKISKQWIYEWAKDEKLNADRNPLGEYFTELIKRMNDKQESFIEENTLIRKHTAELCHIQIETKRYKLDR
jgi:hypothetical protein